MHIFRQAASSLRVPFKGEVASTKGRQSKHAMEDVRFERECYLRSHSQTGTVPKQLRLPESTNEVLKNHAATTHRGIRYTARLSAVR